MQINKLTHEKQTQNTEVKNYLFQLHSIHVSTLLNPFFEDEYATKDDGKQFSVFTKINQSKRISDD